MISVRTNVASLNAQRNLSRTQGALGTNIQRLSSGLRINSAADDAAGLSITQNLNAQIGGIKQATRNANDAISVIQTAEGALGELSNVLTRMRELAVQAANDGALGSNERAYVDQEFQLLESELNRIVGVTEFNGQKLINGAMSSGVDFQVGMRNTANDRIGLTIVDTDATALGLNDESLSMATGAQQAIDALDSAIQSIATMRGTLGATQNRLSITISNLTNMTENFSASVSRIQDTDVALETAQMTRNQILSQAGVAVLAQANQLPQSALSLLG
ncbi:MAG: flagellin [Myxococcota bacterium]|nr:flagellin [Myxococcota bacterium]